MPNVFGLRLRAAREAASLHQKDLARLADVREYEVYRWEARYQMQPRIANVQRLAEALGLTVQELLTFPPAAPPDPADDPYSADALAARAAESTPTERRQRERRRKDRRRRTRPTE